jgi:anthranilate phosphoribosyltransferase
MFKEMINRLVNGEDLTEGQMVDAMETIMGGEATHSQMAAFLTALRMKGETVAEIAGAARVMRERATPMKLGVEVVDIDREEINVERETMVDTCGTGGDSTNTFNISTATAFVLAGAGLTVAKHGNRSVSSLCGSADVLEALGVNLEVTTEVVQSCISKVGIGFMFAPLFHSAMKHVAPVRREMGIRTVFNILGPLANPAGAKRQVLGVYKRELVPVMAEVLGRLGAIRAMVVHGGDGLDEITITGPTFVAELNAGVVTQYEVSPEQFGIPVSTLEDIKGGDAGENADIIRKVLGGEPGPCRDVVLLNAAAALYVAERAPDIKGGLVLAAEAIDNGSSRAKLTALVEATNR